MVAAYSGVCYIESFFSIGFEVKIMGKIWTISHYGITYFFYRYCLLNSMLRESIFYMMIVVEMGYIF